MNSAKAVNNAFLQLLLERGASLDPKDEDGAIPLHDACAGGMLTLSLVKQHSENLLVLVLMRTILNRIYSDSTASA